MSLRLENLDEATRQLMLQELMHDIQAEALYTSPRLNTTGCAKWPDLLRQAIERHDAAWLANALRSAGCMAEKEQKRKPKGGYTEASVPVTAPDTLAEGEFNRFYIRALCQRSIRDGGALLVYRAKQVVSPRAESEALIGTSIDAPRILNDLRTHIGTDTALGLPPGPNSGLSIRMA